MPISYSNPVKAARMQAVLNSIDAQATAGKLVLQDAMYGTLCTIPLNKPCGSVSAGSSVVLNITAPAVASASAAGTIAHAAFKDGLGNDVGTNLTVGTVVGGSDVVLSSLLVTLNEPIQINSITLRHA